MGLDTSHNCWHGSYGGFKMFRDEVAVAAKVHYGYKPDYKGHPMRAFLGWWDNDWDGTAGDPSSHFYGDILDVFFVHSDCDGYIFPMQARPLADALDALVGYMVEDDPNWSPRSRLRQFVAGLRAAADEYEIVTFH